jgi:hypothetical protein
MPSFLVLAVSAIIYPATRRAALLSVSLSMKLCIILLVLTNCYGRLALLGNVTLLVFVMGPHLPPVFQGRIGIITVALNSVMAFIVFRMIRFGIISADGTNMGDVSTIQFAAGRKDRAIHGGISLTERNASPVGTGSSTSSFQGTKTTKSDSVNESDRRHLGTQMKIERDSQREGERYPV